MCGAAALGASHLTPLPTRAADVGLSTADYLHMLKGCAMEDLLVSTLRRIPSQRVRQLAHPSVASAAVVACGRASDWRGYLAPQVVAALLQEIQAADDACGAELRGRLRQPPPPLEPDTAHRRAREASVAGGARERTQQHTQQHTQQQRATGIAAMVDRALGGDTAALCALAQHPDVAASVPAMQARLPWK